jgi:hypothetical protein
VYSYLYNDAINIQYGNTYNLTSLSVGARIYRFVYPCICNMSDGNYIVPPLGVNILTNPEIVYIVTVSDCTITQIVQCNGNTGIVTLDPNGSGGSSPSNPNGINPLT